MLAPLVLPVQITAVLLMAALVLIAALAHEPKKVRLGYALAFLLFIPSCIGVSMVVDNFRYGEFHYATAYEIRDPYLSLPRPATDITLFKWLGGHQLRFHVSHRDLQDWMKDYAVELQRFGSDTEFKLDDDVSTPEFRTLEWQADFGRFGWPFPADAVRYRGWRSARGGGCDLWYSPAQEMGCITATYW